MEQWQSEDLEFADSSPRISFSCDLSTATTADTGRLDAALLSRCSSPEFSFRLSSSNNIFSGNSSLADEFSSDGILRPLPIKNTSTLADAPLPPSPPAGTDASSSMSMPGTPAVTKSRKKGKNNIKKPSSRYSFWPFGRDRRLGSSGRRAGFWPFPLLQCMSTVTSSSSNRHNYSYNVAMRNSIGSNASLGSSASTASSKGTYNYSRGSRRDDDGGDGLPVVAVHDVPAGIFDFLLCSCGKTKKGA